MSEEKKITNFGEEEAKEEEETREGRTEIVDRKTAKELAITLGFKQKKDNPDLFWKKISDDVIEFIDFRKTDKGSRYVADHGRIVTNSELEHYPDLMKFKELRDNPEKAEEAIQMMQPETIEIAERKASISDFSVKGEYYEVGEKKIPDAWKVQQWANEMKYSTQIVHKDQTNGYATATVRVIDNQTGQFVEEAVWHDFENEKDSIMFDLMDEQEESSRKGKSAKLIDGFTDDGRPILTTEGKKRFLRRYLRFKTFALRDAISKAARRAQLKILNYEWREEEEKELEKKEVTMVEEEEQ
jgi:hypothetical protein